MQYYEIPTFDEDGTEALEDDENGITWVIDREDAEPVRRFYEGQVRVETAPNGDQWHYAMPSNDLLQIKLNADRGRSDMYAVRYVPLENGERSIILRDPLDDDLENYLEVVGRPGEEREVNETVNEGAENEHVSYIYEGPRWNERIVRRVYDDGTHDDFEGPRGQERVVERNEANAMEQMLDAVQGGPPSPQARPAVMAQLVERIETTNGGRTKWVYQMPDNELIRVEEIIGTSRVVLNRRAPGSFSRNPVTNERYGALRSRDDTMRMTVVGEKGEERVFYTFRDGDEYWFGGTRERSLIIRRKDGTGTDTHYHYPNGALDPRKYREDLPDGRIRFYHDVNGFDSLVREELPGGIVKYYEGQEGQERLRRIRLSDGTTEYYEGPRGAEVVARTVAPDEETDEPSSRRRRIASGLGGAPLEGACEQARPEHPLKCVRRSI